MQRLRALIVVLVWPLAALVVLGCILGIWLGSVDWGDGGRAGLSTLEIVALVVVALAAVATAVVVSRRLHR